MVGNPKWGTQHLGVGFVSSGSGGNGPLLGTRKACMSYIQRPESAIHERVMEKSSAALALSGFGRF